MAICLVGETRFLCLGDEKLFPLARSRLCAAKPLPLSLTAARRRGPWSAPRLLAPLPHLQLQPAVLATCLPW